MREVGMRGVGVRGVGVRGLGMRGVGVRGDYGLTLCGRGSRLEIGMKKIFLFIEC